MVTKTILAFWTALCWAICIKVMGESGSDGGSVFAIFITGFIWSLIAVPMALLGLVFKRRVDAEPKNIGRDRLIVAAAAFAAFALVFMVPHDENKKKNDRYSNSGYSSRTYYNNSNSYRR